MRVHGVSPWPGKCLAQAATPAPCSPRTNAATCRATSAGSAPNERMPITGFCGFVLTSATGARSTSTPARRQVGAHRPRDLLGQLDVVDDAEAAFPGYELPVEPRAA